jgi:hypothetical protein
MTVRPVIAGSFLLVAITAALYVVSTSRTGVLIYAQDDPYIHLAMARTLATTGTWGLEGGSFAPASSSPLWTVLLASLWTVGIRGTSVPLWLNLLGGIVVLWSASWCIRVLHAPRTPDNFYGFLVTAALVLVVPLPALALIGMEHTFQIGSVLVAATLVARRLAGDRGSVTALAVSCAVGAGIRYEFLLLAGVSACLLAVKRDFRGAATTLAGALVPVAIYAAYAAWHGGLILPNSLVMKSVPERYQSVGSAITALLGEWRGAILLLTRPTILLMVVSLAFFVVASRVWRHCSASSWLAILALATIALHVAFVKMDWFYRYDAYLFALGSVALVASCAGVKVDGVPGVIFATAILVTLFSGRGLPAMQRIPTATVNILEQQCQMARFFAIHYPREVVAVNDIGLVAWEGNVRVLDLAGLASNEVAELRRKGHWTTDELERVVNKSSAAIVAVYGFPFFDFPDYPAAWVRLGTWRITDNVAAGHDIVTFLAPTTESARRGSCALKAFDRRLPGGVQRTLEPLAGQCE